MVQSRTCVQKVARSHVHLVLPFGFKCHRETRRTGRYQDLSRLFRLVTCLFSSTTQSCQCGQLVLMRLLFGACVPHSHIIVIACARSRLEAPDRSAIPSSQNSSRRPVITFPRWRALSFALSMSANLLSSQPHFSGDQINQTCHFDVLDGTAVTPHFPYLDFCRPQRLSPTSL
jgi:hypothetical protein